MGGGVPQSPESEPSPRALEPVPPREEGFNFKSARDWYLRFLNFREQANNKHIEEVKGIRVRLALLLSNTAILGWSHSTVIGGTLTQIKGPDLKMGAGGMFSFIGFGKTEHTGGNKDEKIYGWKISHITGKKSTLVTDTDKHNSAAKLLESKNKCAEYWTLRKELEQLHETKAAEMELHHGSLEGSYKSTRWEYRSVDQNWKMMKERADRTKDRYSKMVQDCNSVKEHATAQYQIIAASAAEVLASGKWEGYSKGDVKLMASSLQTFAASLTKLG